MSLPLDLGRNEDGGIRLEEEWTFARFRKAQDAEGRS